MTTETSGGSAGGAGATSRISWVTTVQKYQRSRPHGYWAFGQVCRPGFVLSGGRYARPAMTVKATGVAPGRRQAVSSAQALSRRKVAAWLVGFAAISTIIRAILVLRVHAPSVFSRVEIGYEKLAQSIGRDGKVALFDREGLSFSPLYPLVLSPIYALGASAPTAYALIKVVNAFLLSLSVFPVYGIARFVLPRRTSLLVAGLSLVAPLMVYSSLTISENLAYPLCLIAVWATLRALRETKCSGRRCGGPVCPARDGGARAVDRSRSCRRDLHRSGGIAWAECR